MNNAKKFKEMMRAGEVPLGVTVTFTDSTVTEALCNVCDFVWIDMEHNGYTLETVQAHIMATKGSDTAALVRVRWNDPVLIKPVLDIGAAGVILPMVKTAEEARRAVAACLYPPDGTRGYGPRRTVDYGQRGGTNFCKEENEAMIIIVQIEHIDAINNLDEIFAVPGITSFLMGQQDLAGSMGHMGNPDHPEVVNAIDTYVSKAKTAGVNFSLAGGGTPETLIAHIDRGVDWLTIGLDFMLMINKAEDFAHPLREYLRTREKR
jgi:2-keto-3-deoxy-L-rhamnonate aldolase RhmA